MYLMVNKNGLLIAVLLLLYFSVFLKVVNKQQAEKHPVCEREWERDPEVDIGQHTEETCKRQLG